MSVSSELLCSFELLKPLDSTALKNHIKKGRNKRNSILSSPVSTTSSWGGLMPSDHHGECNHAGTFIAQSAVRPVANKLNTACGALCPEFLNS